MLKRRLQAAGSDAGKTVLGGAIFAVLAAVHFSYLMRVAVDLPLADEWTYFFYPGNLDRSFNPAWLLAQHNEHRLLPTKLLGWVLLRTVDMDFRVGIGLGFVIFATSLLLFMWIARLQCGARAWVLWPFLWLVLTPENEESNRSFLSPWHFNLLFLLLAGILLFHPRPSRWKLAMGTCATLLGIVSLSSGVAWALVLAACFVAQRLWQRYRTGARLKDHADTIAVGGTIVLAVLLWLLTYHSAGQGAEFTLPSDGRFWGYLVNGISLAFGNSQDIIPLGWPTFAAFVLYGAIFALPMGLQLTRRPPLNADATLAIRIAILAATIGCMTLVSIGRAKFGIGQALSSRYYEFVLPLVPLAALGWTAAPQPWLRRAALVVLWLLVFAIDKQHWFFGTYDAYQAKMANGEACVRAYYRDHGTSMCPDLHSTPLDAELERARQLNVSFVKRLSAP